MLISNRQNNQVFQGRALTTQPTAFTPATPAESSAPSTLDQQALSQEAREANQPERSGLLSLLESMNAWDEPVASPASGQGNSGAGSLEVNASTAGVSTDPSGAQDTQNRDASGDPEKLAKFYGIVGSGADTATDLVQGLNGNVSNGISRLTDDGTGNASSRAGSFGSGANVVGGLLSMPKSWGDAFTTGDNEFEDRAEVSSAVSNTTALAKDTVESAQNSVRGTARRAAVRAARQAMPTAPRSVTNAAAREAAEMALDPTSRRGPDVRGVENQGSRSANRTARTAEAGRAEARRGNPNNPTTEVDRNRATTRQATRAAGDSARRSGGTLASTMGTTSESAARRALREGGERAATAATQAAARRTVAGAIARTGGRFIPGMNVAIAAADAATAVNTLRDPDAGPGKKTTAVITAIGSGMAASNIPVVSQVGGLISAASSWVGSWFE